MIATVQGFLWNDFPWGTIGFILIKILEFVKFGVHKSVQSSLPFTFLHNIFDRRQFVHLVMIFLICDFAAATQGAILFLAILQYEVFYNA